MEPRWGLHNSHPLRIPAQYPAGLSSAAPSSSAAAGLRVSHSASIISTQPLNATGAASPPPIPLSYSSLRLLQEIEETRKLLRTFRSLKERGASRAELADLHSRVKALKAAQKFQQEQDAGACNKLTLPAATSTTVDAAAAITQPSFVCLTRASSPSSYARHRAGVALQGEAAGRTVGSSSSSHQPQPQKPRGVVEAHATHRDGQLHERRHQRRHRHEVHVNPVPSLPISTSLSTDMAQVSASVHNGVSNPVSSSNAGTQSAAALRPNGVSSVAGSLLQLNSIVFAVALAEAHMRREIAHRWERRWLRHWASFKEERIAIALLPPPTLMAARSRPQLLPERWAEASPMVLPCERPQWQQSKSVAVPSAEVSSAAAATKAHIIEASLAPAPGRGTGEVLTVPTSSHAHSGLEQRPLLSAGGGGGEPRQAAESHREEIPNADGLSVEESAVLCAGPLPQHQPQPAAPITQRGAGESSCAAADAAAFSGAVSSEEEAACTLATPVAEAQAAAASAAERLAAALRSIEDDEAAARIATESAAAEAEEAWKAVQSLAVAEARARVTLEGDEACSRASHAAAERYGAERAAFAAAGVAARRRAQEERKRHAAAARVAAADAEAAERCSIEQQWQADVRLTESLLAGWIRDAVAADLQSACSKDKPALERPLRDEATMEHAQARDAAEAQADRRERKQALEQCVTAFSAATDAVLGELTSVAATEAVAQERQAEQAAAAEAARRRREEEEAAARAEAVEKERASVAARAAVLSAEEKGRDALVASEERAWQLQQEAADVEVMYLATEEQARRRAERAEDAARVKAEKEVAEDAIRLAAAEEAARLQVEHRAAAARGQLERDAAKAREAAAAVLTATLCSAVTDLSKNLVESCLAEAAQQARKQGQAAVASAVRDRAAAEEQQMEWREKIEGEEALARDEMRGDALGELERLRDEEAAAEVRRRTAVEAMASVKELERQQQQTCRRAAAQCLHLSEWCDALLLDLLHGAASAAVSVVERTATAASGRASEAPPPAALPEGEESEANAFMENEQQHHHPPFTAEATEGPSALTEEARVDGVDRLGKASSEAVAEEVAAAIASPPLSPTSSAGPSSFFMDSASADAKPGAAATDALKGRTDEYLRLPSPAALVRLVDGLLSDVLHGAAMEARNWGAINEAITNETGAAHRSMQHRMPVPDGSDASLASIDSGGSWSSSVRSPPQALQLRPLALPSPFMVTTGVAGDHAQQVPHTSDELNDSAKVDAVGGAGSTTWSPAAVTEVDDRASHRRTVSPLLISPVDLTATNAAALSTASAAGVKERISATGAATAASSPLHCFSTASSADDDDDTACRSFTAPEAPLPLHLRQRSVLFPLLSQRPDGGGGVDDDNGEVTTHAGSEGDKNAAAGTMTGTALAHRPSSSGKRETRQQLHGNPVASDRNPTSGSDEKLPAVTMAGSAIRGITEDPRAFQLDAPSPPHGESEHRAEAGIAAADAFSVDAVAAAAASLVDRIVHEATLVADSRGQSIAVGTDSDREESRDGVEAGHAAASPSLFSRAQGHAQSTAEGKLRHNGSSASTSCCSNGSDGSGLAPPRIGGDELHAEKRASGAESIPGVTSADTREAALRVSRASSLAAAAVAAEGITGAHSSLASLSTLVSAAAAPNHFATHLRQQEAEKKAVAYQQNRYLTHRELALVAARYLTSEAAAAHVMEIGPTAMLSARAVALALSVGLVRAATLENRRARRRVKEAGRGVSRSTSGAGVLAEEKESPKLTLDSGAASAAMNSPSAWLSSMSGSGTRDGFPIGTIGKAGQERGNDGGGVDMPPGSPSMRCHGGGGGFGPIGPAAPSAVGCAKRGNGSGACSPFSPAAPVPTPSTESGEVKEADMSGSLMNRESPSLSQQVSLSSGPASQQPTYGGEEGALASSAAQPQARARDKLPADWATALRGVAERIAHDFIDYASRCVLLSQAEGHSHQDDLRTARCIHSDALARIDVQELFTHELQLRDVARLTYYYVELANNGPRDRVDPHCAPAVLGGHNMFGRRSRGDLESDGDVAATSRFIDVGNEDAPGFDHLDSSSTEAPAPRQRHQCPPSSSSSLCHPRSSRILSAAAAIHIRRAGLLQLVLEQCVSNVLHDLVGDTVGWLWTAYLQATPSGAAADGGP
ncbi:hypothetical protein CUR178_07628 [Leishmania enriettii]|uniref:Kinetoplast-associated protein-like protein n=1 Tax=Leishmania enriettii TaxID=5663 RepID=A0A836HHI0_LEIEN|nr:hypothetical protein CUR178_07628 [Leishmania enriettii]